MNKSQAEMKVYSFHAVLRVDVNDVKPSQNTIETLPFDHFLEPQSMPRLFKTKKKMVDSNLALIDPVSAFYYGGQAGNAHTKMIT